MNSILSHRYLLKRINIDFNRKSTLYFYINRIIIFIYFAIKLVSCNLPKKNKEFNPTVSIISNSTEDSLEYVKLRNKATDDSLAFEILGLYNGEYQLSTENDGVLSQLNLNYLGNKTFYFDWNFRVDNETAQCSGKLTGQIVMDQTQHGFALCNNTKIHFNFNGFWNGHYLVEFSMDNQDSCNCVSGNCIFSGIYFK